MTREQIIRMTRETGRLVTSGKVGATPRSARHVARLEELKAALQTQNMPTQDKPLPGPHDAQQHRVD